MSYHPLKPKAISPLVKYKIGEENHGVFWSRWEDLYEAHDEYLFQEEEMMN